MLDLREFYIKNITESSPYKKYEQIIFSEDFQVLIHEDESIQEFKAIIQPDNEPYYKERSQNKKFILICYYLNYQGYYLNQFPDLLQNPTSLWDFANSKIRNHLIINGKDKNGTVEWSERRILIEELKFNNQDKIKTNFDRTVEETFKRISTRGAKFDNMSEHEKLKEIANYLEYILKEGTRYKKVEQKDMLDLLSDDIIKRYRKILQCYRHATEDSLEERQQLAGKEHFLIYLGISIIHGLYKEK